jgi:peptidylprolyl isomerase
MVQAGDITYGSQSNIKDEPNLGTGGVSIFGDSFSDENLKEFNTVYNLAMANTGPDTNDSQFFINTFPSPHLNGKHTIFGKIIYGKSTVKTIEYTSADSKYIPTDPVVIEDCGIWNESLGVPVYNASYNSIAGDIYEEYPDDDDHFDKENPEESYKASEIIKNSGGELFKLKNYQEAFFKYKKALRYVNELIPDKDSSLELNVKFEDLKKKLFLNLALTSINLKDYKQSITYSTYLLETTPISSTEKAKGYYRRGVALFELKKYNDALIDLQKCFELNANDQIVKRKIEDTEKLIQQQKDKDKQKYAKFFGK